MLKIIVTFSLCLLVGVSTVLGETILRTLEVKEDASGLAFDGTNLWHGIYGVNGEWLYKIDYDNGDILDSIQHPGDDCYGLTWDGNYLWVMCAYPQDSIYQIDTLGTIITAFPALADYHAGLAWDGNYLWNGRYYPDPGWIFKLDPTNGNPLDTIPPPEDQTWDLTWDGSYLWVCDKWADSVYQVDTTDGSVQLSFASPAADPTGLAWDGNYLWLTDWYGLAYQIDPYGGGGPVIQLSASEHDYGVVTVGDSVDWDLGISNLGDADLIVDSMSFNTTVFFTSTVFPDTVEADSSIQVPITYSPTSIDTFIDTATVYSNDPIHPTRVVELRGIGVAAGPEIYLPEISHDYGSIRVGAVKQWFCQIINLGDQILVIDSVKIDSPEFWVSGVEFPDSITTLSSLALPVWFSPPYGGSFSATLTIYSNDPDEPSLAVSLSGYGDDSPNPGGEVLWYYYATDWDPSVKAIISIPDINGDGIDDVVAGSENDTIYCFNGNSSGQADVLWTFVTSPLWRQQELISVCDLDGDGIDDVVIGTPWGGRSVIALSSTTGDTLWIWDSHQYGGGGWVYEVAEMADVDGDLICDILAAAGDDGNGTGPGGVYCLSGVDGTEIWGGRLYSQGTNIALFSVRAIDDVTGDGTPDVAAGSGDTQTNVERVWMLNGASGDTIWSQVIGNAVWAVVPIEDISGDGVKDVVAGIGVGTGLVWAFDATDGDSLWCRAVDGGVEQLYIISDVNDDDIDDILPSGLMSDFYCLDGGTGAVIWSRPSGHMAFASVPMPDLTGDLKEDVIAGSGYTYNRIYCLNGATGDTLWTHPADGAVETVYWMHSIDKQTAEALSGSRNGEVLSLSGGLTLFGAIAGKVTDETSAQPIESAVVTADGYTDTTNIAGEYLISIPTGFYELIATAENYYPDTSSWVSVTVNETTTVNFALSPLFVPTQFIRGDVDGSGYLAIGDGLRCLRCQFVPGWPDSCRCDDATDADDNGTISIGDCLRILRKQFVPGWQDSIPPPCCSAPGDCGVDPTEDELGCESHPACEGGVTQQPAKKEKISRKLIE